MGLIRLLLALSVVIDHSTPIFGLRMVGGAVAVKAFYIISGFYMSLILNEKYTGRNSYKLFITNRFLRLYPVYWAVLILTLLAALAAFILTHHAQAGALQPYIDYLRHSTLPLSTSVFLFITNLIFFGQDLVLFLGIHTGQGTLFFTPDFSQTTPPLHSFMLVPQAWTIAVELLFYLIAPFLVRKKVGLILLLIVASIALRLLAYSHGLNHDPWTYRFFPFELAFFLLGNLSYRIYRRLRQTNYLQRAGRRAYVPIGLVMLVTLVYQWISLPYKNVFYYALVFVLVPFIFLKTKSLRRDGAIGELSYPVYISHILVISLIVLVFPKSPQLGLEAAVLTIFLSIVLNILVALPVERIRQRRVRIDTEPGVL
jgi:peptidoglycan/LPS O-acetylase OafA/YrhL